MNRPVGRFANQNPVNIKIKINVNGIVCALFSRENFVESGVYGDAFEDFADFGCQSFQVEGLLQESHAAFAGRRGGRRCRRCSRRCTEL